MMRDYSALEPIIYKMFDYGDEDLATTHPEWGDVGSYNFFCWDWLHTGYNQYNFSRIENWLVKLAGKRRPSGAPQSGVMKVINHISSYPDWPGWKDCTPTFVYDRWDAAYPGRERPVMRGRKVGHVVTLRAQAQAVPAYEDRGFWWSAQAQFIEALGRWYGSLHPEIKGILKAIFFSPGIDGEAQGTKSGVLDPSGIRFSQLCEACIAWWDQAFPDLPLFMVVGPGQGSLKLAQLCHARGIGCKNNGLQDDVDSSKGYSWKRPEGDPLEEQLQVGLWDAQRWALQVGQPVWIESAHNISPRQRNMAMYHALHFRPVGIDLHTEWLKDVKPEELDFLRQHLNRSNSDAPGAWCRLRDTAYPLSTWPSSTDGIRRGYSGHTGDFGYLLHMAEGAVTTATAGLGSLEQPGSLGCRLINEARFDVAPGFAPGTGQFRLDLSWYDEGKALQVIDESGAITLQGEGGHTWRTVTAPRSISRTFTLRGDGVAVAWLYCRPEPGPGPEEPVGLDLDAIRATVEQARTVLLEQGAIIRRTGQQLGVIGNAAEVAQQIIQQGAALGSLMTTVQSAQVDALEAYTNACGKLLQATELLADLARLLQGEGEGGDA